MAAVARVDCGDRPAETVIRGDNMKSTGVVKKGIFSRILFVMSLRLVAVMVSGCAPTNVDHAHKASVFCERASSEGVVVSHVRALEDGDDPLCNHSSATSESKS